MSQSQLALLPEVSPRLVEGMTPTCPQCGSNAVVRSAAGIIVCTICPAGPTQNVIAGQVMKRALRKRLGSPAYRRSMRIRR